MIYLAVRSAMLVHQAATADLLMRQSARTGCELFKKEVAGRPFYRVMPLATALGQLNIFFLLSLIHF